MYQERPPRAHASEVSHRVGPFDVFAGWASRIASRAAFFTFWFVIVIVWAPTFFLLRERQHLAADHQHSDDDHHVLDGRTPAEQQTRSDQALQHSSMQSPTASPI